jgi:hypothetical protein
MTGEPTQHSLRMPSETHQTWHPISYIGLNCILMFDPMVYLYTDVRSHCEQTSNTHTHTHTHTHTNTHDKIRMRNHALGDRATPTTPTTDPADLQIVWLTGKSLHPRRMAAFYNVMLFRTCSGPNENPRDTLTQTQTHRHTDTLTHRHTDTDRHTLLFLLLCISPSDGTIGI